jgi:hypothetical protein
MRRRRMIGRMRWGRWHWGGVFIALLAVFLAIYLCRFTHLLR